MKKSEIYKYVLEATIRKLAGDYDRYEDNNEVYEIVHTICDKIDIELLNERREAGEQA